MMNKIFAPSTPFNRLIATLFIPLITCVSTIAMRFNPLIVSSQGYSPASSWRQIQLGELVFPWRTQTWPGARWAQQFYRGMREVASSARQGPELEHHLRCLHQRLRPILGYDLQ